MAGRLAARIHAIGVRAAREMARDIVEEIRPLTPLRDPARAGGRQQPPGTLRAGYRVNDTEGGANIVTDVDYWYLVEFGTRFAAAQPHVRPAVEIVLARGRGRR